MILFNHVNMLESMQEYAGPNWNIFLYTGTPPEVDSAITFDVQNDNDVLRNSVGCIRSVSSILTNPYSLEFLTSSKLYGNMLPGYELSEPRVDNTPLYRVGHLASQSNIPDYNMERRLDLLSGRAALSFTASNTVLDLELTATTDIDYVTVLAGESTGYSVFRVLNGVETLMFSATGNSLRVPHELSVETLADTIRIRFVDGPCVLTSVMVYTITQPADNARTPTWALVVPVAHNAAMVPSGSGRPAIFCSAGGPETTADMRLNKSSVRAQDSLTVLFFRVRPTLMEV